MRFLKINLRHVRFFSVRVRARDRARARTEIPSFAKLFNEARNLGSVSGPVSGPDSNGKKSHMALNLCLWGWLLIGGGGLVSCQYQFGRSELALRDATISVPYIEGDQKGGLTAEVIKKISTSGAFRYVDGGGDFLLKIKLIRLRDENIGFRYDRKKRGGLKRSMIPTETRATATAEVVLIEGGTGQTIRGPFTLSTGVEFDHTYYTTRHALNTFSLGQLNDVDAAHDAMMQPLNRSLADKIVSELINSW